jgi:galactokinase
VTAIRTRVVERFRELYGRTPDLVVRAPGRVNLLGAHVDYNDGWVLPGAIDRAVWLAAGRGAHSMLRASSLELGDGAAVALGPAPGPGAATGRPSAGWMEYAAGVAWALESAGHRVAPLDAVVGSDLPREAGVASSAALEVAFVVAWRALGGLALDEVEAARIGRRAENDYVGVQSGVMDQFASLAGRRDHVVLLDCRTFEWERLPLPGGITVLVGDSGVRRRLVDGPLNDRKGECAEALRRMREQGCELAALRDVDRDALDAAGYLPDALRRRVRHVVEECERVKRGGSLLRDGRNARALGALVSESHRSSRDLYQVSIPELDVLAEAAWAAPGCHGARLMGAGFGGCVAALVEDERASDVAAAMELAFAARFGRSATIHRCRIADGASVE